MELIPIVVAFVAGAAVGLMGYRYLLKRDPEKLEQWAQQIKAKARG